MDEDLSIINANTRNEKIKNFFVNNRKILIFIITIFIFLVIGVYSYDKYLTEKKKDISDNFRPKMPYKNIKNRSKISRLEEPMDVEPLEQSSKINSKDMISNDKELMDIEDPWWLI